MSVSNVYGDVVLDAHGMRALAHPTRLALLTRLREQGPSTATALSGLVGVSPSVASWHLRHLAVHGLVEDAPARGHGRQRWWQAARGFRFVADDDDSADAARALTQVIEQVEGDLPARWRSEVEPHLDREWRRLAVRANTTIVVTADELAELEGAVEQLLAPYVARRDGDRGGWPDDTRTVRILRYALPELAEPADPFDDDA